jgi:hypothetical protein
MTWVRTLTGSLSLTSPFAKVRLMNRQLKNFKSLDYYNAQGKCRSTRVAMQTLETRQNNHHKFHADLKWQQTQNGCKLWKPDKTTTTNFTLIWHPHIVRSSLFSFRTSHRKGNLVRAYRLSAGLSVIALACVIIPSDGPGLQVRWLVSIRFMLNFRIV